MEQDRVIALGFFDGVHRGHQAILNKAAELARQGGLEVAAVTFETHPRAYVRGRAPDLVCSCARRCALLQQNGAGLVVALPFDREMAETLPEDFAAMLRDRYRCRAVVCGENYHFGRNAAGRPEDFRRFGLEAHVVPPVLYRGRVVSSTYIRESVRDGKVGRARQLLGRPFFLEGPIVGGFQVGRTLDCPTINIRVEDGILMPHRGVYVSRVTVDGQTYPAVTNVGTRPTFTDADIVSVESHILNFSGDIYGHEARVDFLKFLRPERGFSDGQALRAQIAQDIRRAMEYRG